MQRMKQVSLKKSDRNEQLGMDVRDLVRVNVGSRSPVFEVTEALSSHMTGDSDRCSSVGDTAGEVSDMSARERVNT